MSQSHYPQQNRLLAALPAEEFDRLAPELELISMPLGEALYESGGQLQHVYFPTTSIVSLLYVMENGASDCSIRAMLVDVDLKSLTVEVGPTFIAFEPGVLDPPNGERSFPEATVIVVVQTLEPVV